MFDFKPLETSTMNLTKNKQKMMVVNSSITNITKVIVLIMFTLL